MNDEDAGWGDELDAYLHAYVEEERDGEEAAAEAAYARFELERRHLDTPTPIPSRTPQVAVVAAVVALAAGLIGVWMFSARALDPRVGEGRGAAAADVVDTSAQDHVATPGRVARPRRRPVQTYQVEPAPEEEAEVEPELPEPAAGVDVEPSPSAERPRRSPAPALDPAPSSLARELASLRALRATSRAGDYAGVLSRARAHRREFENPTMAAERDLIELEALCGLGRLGDVARAKAAFAKAHPRHHLRSKAERVCEAG